MGRKKYSLILFAALFLLAGCETAQNTETGIVKEEKPGESETVKKDVSELKIGVTMADKDSDYLVEVSKYMQEAAKEKGVALETVYADWDATVQEQQLETFISQKVDAIVLCPVNAKTMLTALKEAKEAGIPVINLNMKVDAISTEYVSTYVGASMAEEAALAAELVTDILGEKGGKVGVIEGAPGSDPQIYRTQTFLEQLLPWPKIEVVGIVNGNWDRNMGYLAAVDLIKKDGELDVIYCHDSNMAMGAYEALKSLGLEKQVKVIGVGSAKEYLDALKDGKLYGIITQPPDYEGAFSIYCAIMAAQGQELRPWYKNPVEILTKENVDTYVSPMESQYPD